MPMPMINSIDNDNEKIIIGSPVMMKILLHFWYTFNSDWFVYLPNWGGHQGWDTAPSKGDCPPLLYNFLSPMPQLFMDHPHFRFASCFGVFEEIPFLGVERYPFLLSNIKFLFFCSRYTTVLQGVYKTCLLPPPPRIKIFSLLDQIDVWWKSSRVSFFNLVSTRMVRDLLLGERKMKIK